MATRTPAGQGELPTALRDDSFEAVVLPHLDAAHGLARWLMRDAGTAEDVLQEAMLRALTYYAGFRGGSPRAWLLQIVRNVAYGTMRLDRGAQHIPLAASPEEADAGGLDPPSDEDNPEMSLIRSRDRRLVRELIAGLPVELREALVLRELEELSYKEIAAVTQTPIGTVMSRLWRARRLLLAAAAAAERTG